MTDFLFAVFISGSGSNLQAMINAVKEKKVSGKICCVLSNNEEAYGLIRAKKAGIPTEVINNDDFDNREDFDNEMIKVLAKYEPDLIVLAGFMRILSPLFVKVYNGKLLNSIDGGPICAQSSLKINTSSVVELEDQIHKLEHELYPKVINWFGEGLLKLSGDKVYFDGKELIIKGKDEN